MNIERYLKTNRGGFCPGFPRIGILGEPLLVSFHRFRRLEPVQSAFTNWCPMMTILRKAGVKA